jgi:hypothetical protein
VTLEDIRIQEREALMTEYLFPEGAFAKMQVPPYCAVPDFHVLETTPRSLRTRYPIRVEVLAGKEGKAWVQTCDGLKYKFLWAHVDDDDYRDSYLKFLVTHHRMNISAIAENYHVDHLYNRARAREMKLPFVRMGLLPRSVNTSHGAGYEKQRTHGAIGTPGNQRGIDEILLMKLWDIPSPRKGQSLTPAMQAHLDRMANLFGIPRAELLRNVADLMEVAAFRPKG